VIVSHESALLPNGGTEPLTWLGGGFATLGTVAVDVFFVTSGFLVTRSLLERRSLRHFVAARLLRVLPGLAVMLVLTAYVLGPLFTSLPVTSYLTDPAVPDYVARNLNLAVDDPQWTLLGVFATLTIGAADRFIARMPSPRSGGPRTGRGGAGERARRRLGATSLLLIAMLGGAAKHAGAGEAEPPATAAAADATEPATSLVGPGKPSHAGLRDRERSVSRPHSASCG